MDDRGPGSAVAPVQTTQALPTALKIGGHETMFRLLTPEDKEPLLAFARRQPPRDLLFLRRDITNSSDVDAWLHDIEIGSVTTVLATRPDGVVSGYATLDRGRLRWTRHIAEIRVLVDSATRGQGLGRVLLQIAFERALATRAQKIVAQMMPDQVGARTLFERLGFEQEATLRNHVIDADGETHDLLVLTFDIRRQQLASCEGCGTRVMTRLSLAGQQLCWSCYEIAYAEIGGGG